VDTETGQITVERILMVADAGRVINPITASGQVEGGLQQVLGFAHCEEMVYHEDGRLANPRFGPYHVYKANEMPKLEVIGRYRLHRSGCGGRCGRQNKKQDAQDYRISDGLLIR
jgi:CO/xanthine dehydrogenase Mo-binding subunit